MESDAKDDRIILRILPVSAPVRHLTFNGVVYVFRELLRWSIDKIEGEDRAWNSLARLRKQGLVVMGNHPNSQLTFAKVAQKGVIE